MFKSYNVDSGFFWLVNKQYLSILIGSLEFQQDFKSRPEAGGNGLDEEQGQVLLLS